MGELLRLAGVSSSDKKAAAWLSDAIVLAKSIYRAAKQRPLPVDHNALLGRRTRRRPPFRSPVHQPRRSLRGSSITSSLNEGQVIEYEIVENRGKQSGGEPQGVSLIEQPVDQHVALPCNPASFSLLFA
jgi:hypothetical protein